MHTDVGCKISVCFLAQIKKCPDGGIIQYLVSDATNLVQKVVYFSVKHSYLLFLLVFFFQHDVFKAFITSLCTVYYRLLSFIFVLFRREMANDPTDTSSNKRLIVIFLIFFYLFFPTSVIYILNRSFINKLCLFVGY